MAPYFFGYLEDQNHGESNKSLQYHFIIDKFIASRWCAMGLGCIPLHGIDSMMVFQKIIKNGL